MAALFWAISFLGIFLILASVLLLGGCIYLYYIHDKYSHLPGPRRSSFFLGNIPDLVRYQNEGKIAADYFLDLYHTFGPIYVMFFAYRPAVFVTDPHFLKEIFIDSDKYLVKYKNDYERIGFPYGVRALGYGLVTNRNRASWLRRRQIINPAFHRKYLKNLMVPFNEVCDRLCKQLATYARESKDIDMSKEFGNAALDLIGKVAFSIDLGAIEDASLPFRSAAASVLEAIQHNMYSPFPTWFLRIYQRRCLQSETQRRQIDAVKFLRDFARKCILKRLTMVKDGDDVPSDILSCIVRCTEKDESLTIEDLVDEFITIFFAGHETTASSLAFTLFEVISNREIEKKILEEVEEVIGSKECVDYEDLTKLKYIGQCLMEGLRKFKIAGGPSRILTKEIIVGGYKLPAGCPIGANKYAFNRSPNFWNDPDVFNPDRFACPEEIPHFRYVFFPFSLGPRNCIGQTFAMFEEKILLARLIQKFKFQLIPGQTCKIKERFTYTPNDGVLCTVELR